MYVLVVLLIINTFPISSNKMLGDVFGEIDCVGGSGMFISFYNVLPLISFSYISYNELNSMLAIWSIVV